MFNLVKNNKLILSVSLFSISIGILTFFTFINQSFIKLNNLNLQLLLLIDLFLALVFFILIIIKIYKIIHERKQDKIGSKTSLRFIIYFSLITLIPSFIIAIFSLFLFNISLQKYFDNKITSAVNNSYEVANKYAQETRNIIESDILLMAIDINRNLNLYYDNKTVFKNILRSQRLLRRIDEVHLLDSAGNILLSDLVYSAKEFIPPPQEAFDKSIGGKPIKITDSKSYRTSALLKLENFIDTYLYIVRSIDPKLTQYLKDTKQAVNFYYSIESNRTGIKITFALIYLVIVSLLLFLSVIIAINFASRLTKPIINLIGASEKISSGDLNIKVPYTDSDQELQKLNENFNFMIEKLQLQQEKLLVSERHMAWESVARKLAHEIKNPLTPIQLSIDRIKEKYLNKISDGKEDFSSYLLTINKQIKDIENLVNEFSDFARMPKPIFVKVNVEKLILRSIELNKLSNKNINFNLRNYERTFFIKADEEQLNRVFLNLIKNSIESLNEKNTKNTDFLGKIDIDIYEHKDYIYIKVNDNGTGFDEKNVKKMLTPYFTTKKNGTGLGLAIVSKVINDHNGNLRFKSSADGAEVEISIPKYE